MKTNYTQNRYLALLLIFIISLMSNKLLAQQSPNTVKFQVTYNAATQTYTAWVVPNYTTPNSNSNNAGANELVSTAQFTLKVPIGFVINSITDASITQAWDKNPPKLGQGLSLTATNGGNVITQDYSPAVLDPGYAYYVIGKSPMESNLSSFSVNTPVPLFTFKGNGCFGAINPLPVSDPFIKAALDAYSFNVANSFYSSSGQPSGGNQVPLEQFIDIITSTSSCYLAPMANPDIAMTNPGVPVNGNVLTNDSDPQGLPLTATLLSAPVVGTAVLSPSGSYTYTPPVGYTGTVSFCYAASNGSQTATACVTINVVPNPVFGNDAPVANNDATQTTSGVAVVIAVLANDTDPDSATGLNGQLGNPTLLSQPTAGTAVVNANGTVSYTPPAGFTGVVSFPYQVCDKATPTLCATAVVSVNVLPTSPAGTTLAPVAVDDAFITKVNTAVVATVAANDSDPNSPALPLSYTAGAPMHGSVVMSSSGSYTYTPTSGYVGPDSFTYVVCNSAGRCDQATVSGLIQLQETVLKPIANPDIAMTNPGVAVTGDVLTNDSDPQSLPLTALIVSPPIIGTVTLNPTGSYTYTPPTSFTGTASFCYQAINSAGQSATACVTVNVLPIPTSANDAPVANNDATQTTAGVPVTVAVLANDSDPDSATSLNGQLANPTLISQPLSGTASVNANGTVSYTPPAGLTGVISFPYQVCDKGTPALCATAVVSVNVLPTPPAGTTLAPVAVDDALLTNVNTSATGTVAANDRDPNTPALPLSYSSGQPGHGSVAMNSSGSYSYTPTVGYSGPDNFTYLVCNSAGLCDKATVSVDVQTPLNQPPVVVGVPIVVVPGVPGSVCMPIVDSPGDTHMVSLCGAPSSGTIATNINNTTHVLCITYTAPITSTGGATNVCVSVCDAGGQCTTLVVPITIVPFSLTTSASQPPMVVVVPVVTPKDIPVVGCMLIRDPEQTDTHSVSVCGNPSKGTVVVSVDNISHQLCLTYTPTSSLTGNDSFCVTVCDQKGLCTTVTIPVNIVDPTPPGPGNEPPVIVPPAIVTLPNIPVVVCTGIVDSPADTHIVSICGSPASGTAQVGVNNVSHLLCLTYTPGSLPINTSLCVQVCDQTGQCTNVIVPITILPPTTIPCQSIDLTGVSVNISNGGVIMAGQTASFTLAGGNPAYQIDWFVTPSLGVSPVISGTGLMTGNLTFTQPGNYIVWYKLINSSLPIGCTTPTEALVKGQVIVNPAGANPCPVPSSVSVSVSPTNSLTVGQQATFTMLGGSPNTSVSWSVYPASGVNPASGTGTMATVNFSQKGSYVVTFVATNSVVGCTANSRSASTSVYVRQGTAGGSECLIPTPIVITPIAISAQTGSSMTFTASGGVPGQLTWAIIPASSATPFSGTGSVATPTFTAPGTYIITFTSTNNGSPTGCTLPASTATSLAYLVQQGGNLVTLNLKVLLQGALLNSTGGLMRDDLRSGRYLPLMEPYSAINSPRFVHSGGGGGETMPASVTAANVGTGNAIVDWVFVELRNPANMSAVVATRSALVQRDGDVVLASDGTSPLTFTGLSGSSFYVSIKHRNHLGVMTSTAIPLSSTGTVVDFTTMSDAEIWNMTGPLLGYDGAERIVMTEAGGRKALWAGNAYNDSKEHPGLWPDRVKYQGPDNDLLKVFSEVLNYSGNTAQTYNYDFGYGYWFGDVNLDGKVKYQGPNNDPNIIFLNLIDTYPLNTGKLYNFDLFYEQLP